MERIDSKLKDACILEPRVFRDNRGFFLESYSLRAFAAEGISACFVQDNHSLSLGIGVVRGLHFQKPPHAQAKLIRVIQGAIYDVIVDLRRNSPTYGMWEGFELTSENFKMVFVPAGFAHSFCTLTERTEVVYKTDALYSAECDSGLRWNDPDLGIVWPVVQPILSEKDSKLSFFKDFVTPFTE